MVSYFYIALDEWLNLLLGPADPPFAAGTSFQGEWKRFFRLLAISVGLWAAAVGADRYLPGSIHELPKIPVKLAFVVIACFALSAVFYHLYARPFGIRITPRQAFFCFAFILIPWLPIVAMIKLVAARLGIVVLLIASYTLVAYIPFLVAKGIGIVTSASLWRSILSLLLFALIVLLSFVSYVGYSAKPTP